MKKLILPVIAIATISFTSCGGGSSELENALKDLENLSETMEAEIDDAMENLETEVAEAVDADVFTSEDGNYEIKFAGTPTPTDDVIQSVIGEIGFHMDMYEKSLTEAEAVSYNDYPSAIVEEGDPVQMLEDALGGATTNMGLDVQDMKEAGTFQGYPCLDYKGYSTLSNYHVTYKLVMKDNRLYQVMMMRDGSYASEADVERFLGSFKINE